MKHQHAFTKVCRICRADKRHSDFRVSRDYPDGLERVCRTCREDKRWFRVVRHAWRRITRGQ